MSDLFIPDDVRLRLTQSFTATAGLFALHLALENRSKEVADSIKDDILMIWRNQWGVQFQEDLANYTKVLGEVENGDKAKQPEDFQVEFNKLVSEVENSARRALWPEGKK